MTNPYRAILDEYQARTEEPAAFRSAADTAIHIASLRSPPSLWIRLYSVLLGHMRRSAT